MSQLNCWLLLWLLADNTRILLADGSTSHTHTMMFHLRRFDHLMFPTTPHGHKPSRIKAQPESKHKHKHKHPPLNS